MERGLEEEALWLNTKRGELREWPCVRAWIIIQGLRLWLKRLVRPTSTRLALD
jgi:hypothetical protein